MGIRSRLVSSLAARLAPEATRAAERIAAGVAEVASARAAEEAAARAAEELSARFADEFAMARAELRERADELMAHEERLAAESRRLEHLAKSVRADLLATNQRIDDLAERTGLLGGNDSVEAKGSW